MYVRIEIFLLLSFLHIYIVLSKKPNFNNTYKQRPPMYIGFSNITEHKHIYNIYNNCSSSCEIKPEKLSNDIQFEINLLRKDVFNIVFRNLIKNNHEVPKEEPFSYYNESIKFNTNESEYGFQIEYDPFFLRIYRKINNVTLFSVNSGSIYLKKNFLAISYLLTSENIFGLGERTANFKLKDGKYTMYNQDQYGKVENYLADGRHRYGSHPMILQQESSDNNWNIIFLRNNYPIDIELSLKGNRNYAAYNTIGGVFDFVIFLGDKKPETVIKKYHEFIGKFTLPPFWAMGFHQARWGYNSSGYLGNVIDSYQLNQIPLDTIWLDIDYMKDQQPFHVDQVKFNKFEMNKILKLFNVKLVVMAEPTIGTRNINCEYLLQGKRYDIFIKNSKNRYLVNKVWPGKSYFIDFFNPNTKKFWFESLNKLHKNLQFSGIWLDMNEIATFKDGQININEKEVSCGYKKLSFYPGTNKPEKSTICPNAFHYNNQSHIQLHNYYSVAQSKLTYEYLSNKNPEEFPFILSRASAPGLGRYAAHWSGDNHSTNEFYKFSISEMYNFNLFGIPMNGADICGFGHDASEFLCSQWYQLGSLYPFARQHSHHNSNNKEPFRMGLELLNTAKQSISFRYQILKYYYSIFMQLNGTGTLIRPLFFEYPDEKITLTDRIIESQFLIGKDLMVVPNLNFDKFYLNETVAYFPQDDWYDLRFYKKINKKFNETTYEQVSVELNLMPAVFQRGKSILFANSNTNITSSYSLNDEFILIVALDTNTNEAKGLIPALNNYNNKTEVSKCMENDCYIPMSAKFSSDCLNIDIKQAKFYPATFSKVSIIRLVLLGINTQNYYYIKKEGIAIVDNIKYKIAITIYNKDSMMFVFDSKIEVKREKKIHIQICLN